MMKRTRNCVIDEVFPPHHISSKASNVNDRATVCEDAMLIDTT
jgi:hypothetical protein